MNKKYDIKALLAAVAAAVAMIMYVVSFHTYPAAAENNMLGTLFGVCAILLMVVCFLGISSDKARSVMILAAGILIILFFYQFIMGRVTVTADAFFIPVNHPAEEDTAMTQTIVGLAAALVSFLAITVDAFTARE